MKIHLTLYIITLFWCWCTTPTFAQEPSYQKIGEEALLGIDIYTIAQDSAHNIWLGTDQSLIRYDGYEFKHYHNAAQKNKSLFGLTKDNNGSLFCFNFSGQIFKVGQDSLYLYYSLPDSLSSNINLMNLFFDKNDNIIIAQKNLIKVDKNFKLEILKNNRSPYHIQRGVSWDILVYTPYSTDTIFSWDGQQLNFCCTTPKTISDRSYFSFFSLDQELCGYEHYSKILYKKVDSTPVLQPIMEYPFFSRRVICDNTLGNKILFTHLISKSWLSTKTGKLLYTGNSIFNSYKVGKTLVDKENSSWIGTLGRGLLFIPNLQITTLPYPNDKDNGTFTKLVYDQQGVLYLGSSSGQVYKLQAHKQIAPLFKATLPIEFLKYIEDTDQLFSTSTTNGYLIDIFEKKEQLDGFSSIKDISLIDKDSLTYLLSTNSGLIKYNIQKRVVKWLLKGRSNCSYYDKNNQLGWANTPNGLFLIQHEITQKFASTIFANSIVGNDEYTWIGSTSKGVLQLKGKDVVNKLDLKKGLHSNSIKRLVIKDSLLYIGHNKGIQIYNIVTKSIKTINTTDGLLSNKVIDFDVYDRELSVISNKGLQQLQLDSIMPNLVAPYLELTKILVNDSIWSTAVHDFSYDQNQVSFQFKAKAYRHQNSLNYFYKLSPVDKDWVKTSYQYNQAKYPFLPAGEYMFSVKALNEDGISSEVVEYRFQIHPPFWQTWWFYLILVIILVTIVSWYYQRRAKAQRLEHQQKQELLSSKLTALKSQMNPHFIFNALNSIQALIVTEQPDDAYMYIVKFSNLVRNTLKYSDKDMLAIEDELNLLELYLELEKLRFRKDFEYAIVKNDLAGIQIPPMLIQPFVENAIKHGLLHKKGYKSLVISFEKKEVLVCTIMDNGIGRKQAAAIKQRQAADHQSFSVESTNSRFKILQEFYKGGLGFSYEDLEENGVALGTKVTLRIPYEQLY